jgi:hypothetical protein
MLRVGIYVAEDQDRALSEPRESTMRFYNRLRGGVAADGRRFWR